MEMAGVKVLFRYFNCVKSNHRVTNGQKMSESYHFFMIKLLSNAAYQGYRVNSLCAGNVPSSTCSWGY